MQSKDLDVIDDLIENKQCRVSPTASQTSLSKKLINNYKSQSLQSMNSLLCSSLTNDSRIRTKDFKSSEQINRVKNKNDVNNFSINLVTSEEELDDELDNHTSNNEGEQNDDEEDEEEEIHEEIHIIEHIERTGNTDSMSSLSKYNYTIHPKTGDHSSEAAKKETPKEKPRPSSTSKQYDESDDENTPGNSYHNSSGSNSRCGSYNSLNNNEPARQSILKMGKTKNASLENLKDTHLVCGEQVDSASARSRIKSGNLIDENDYDINLPPSENKLNSEVSCLLNLYFILRRRFQNQIYTTTKQSILILQVF